MTAEAVREGKIICDKNKYKQIVAFPGGLQKEFLDFAERESNDFGPIFQSRDGCPMYRIYVSAVIRNLYEEAKVLREKGNPRCLRKLYLSTKAGVESNTSLLVEQAMERMMEQE